jgi:hypothetical protein
VGEFNPIKYIAIGIGMIVLGALLPRWSENTALYCRSFEGQIAQRFESGTFVRCLGAQAAYESQTILTVLGILVLVLTVGGTVALLIISRREQQKEQQKHEDNG